MRLRWFPMLTVACLTAFACGSFAGSDTAAPPTAEGGSDGANVEEASNDSGDASADAPADAADNGECTDLSNQSAVATGSRFAAGAKVTWAANDAGALLDLYYQASDLIGAFNTAAPVSRSTVRMVGTLSLDDAGWPSGAYEGLLTVNVNDTSGGPALGAEIVFSSAGVNFNGYRGPATVGSTLNANPGPFVDQLVTLAVDWHTGEVSITWPGLGAAKGTALGVSLDGSAPGQSVTVTVGGATSSASNNPHEIFIVRSICVKTE